MRLRQIFLITILLGLSAIMAFAQPNPADCGSFIENDTTYVLAEDYLPAQENLHAMRIPAWQMTPETFSPSKKYTGFLYIPLRLEMFQAVVEKMGGGYFWADLGVFLNYNSDGTLPDDQHRYKKLGVFSDGVNFYFTPVDLGWINPPPTPTPYVHVPDARYMNDYLSFTDGHKTYVRFDCFRGHAPFYAMDAKTWVRTSICFSASTDYAGFWEFPMVLDSMQVVSVTGHNDQGKELYEWSDPGRLGGNWIGDGQLDPNHPYAKFGVRIVPDYRGHHYIFIPPYVSDENLLAQWRQGGYSAVEKNSVIPIEFSLNQNYPNPFNPSTTISFALPQASEVQLFVFNQLGQKIADLINGTLPAGNHQIIWNGTDQNSQSVPSGIYFYQLIANGQVAMKQMMLVK